MIQEINIQLLLATGRLNGKTVILQQRQWNMIYCRKFMMGLKRLKQQWRYIMKYYQKQGVMN